MSGLTIPFEVADGITLASLKEQREYLMKELKDFEEGKWLHPEDVVRNHELIRAMNTLIEYYGG